MSTEFFLGNKGFKIVNFLHSKELNYFLKNIVDKINLSLKGNKFTIKNLKKFHKQKISDKEYNNIIISKNRKIKINQSKFLKIFNRSSLKKIVYNYWGHAKIKIVWVGSAKNNQIENNKVGFRIARPFNSSDAAIEHIDSYNNDDKSFLTIWIPLIGFSKKYSLKFFPGTHKYKHSTNYFEKKTKYISRVFKKSYVKKFNYVRPNLKLGQAIIFHPNLIHGGSINEGNYTRISIEVRIFNKKKYNLKKTFDKKLVN